MNLNSLKDKFESDFRSKSSEYLSEKNALNEAILYSLHAPAKRIRPLLCLGFSKGFGGHFDAASVCSMVIEMIHTYSLIHDDLPAMDNDEYRRGQLTNHKVYGEAMAILAGDSLLNLAPEFLLKELSLLGMESKKIIKLTAMLLESSGHRGMVMGQALDMQHENTQIQDQNKNHLAEILKNIHRLKTGAIITWSCVAGLYSLDNEKIIAKNDKQVKKIGEEIGLLFQMVDDVLDVTSTLKDLGKTPGKDENSHKLTYTNLYGLSEAARMSRELAQEIRQHIGQLDVPNGDWSIILDIIQSLENKLPA